MNALAIRKIARDENENKDGSINIKDLEKVGWETGEVLLGVGNLPAGHTPRR
jgi:hypothetical protein